MQESEFHNLRAVEDLNTFHYHAAGMVEAQNRIRDLLLKLDKWYGKDWRKTASILTELWVEMFDHFKYHMVELRGPFEKIMNESYKKFEEEDPDSYREWSTTLEPDKMDDL